MTDLINHPPHYTAHPSGVECIQITEHMGFNLGNAVKYIWRADLKGNQLADLEKAAWYIQREIQRINGASEVEPTEWTDAMVEAMVDQRAKTVNGEVGGLPDGQFLADPKFRGAPTIKTMVGAPVNRAGQNCMLSQMDRAASIARGEPVGTIGPGVGQFAAINPRRFSFGEADV